MPENDELLEQTETEDENTEPTRSGGDNNSNTEEDDEVSTPNPLGKLKRSALLHYIETSFSTASGIPQSPAWFLIGKHVADMAINMNADTETLKNILDETEVIDNGYAPDFDVDTYYATPTDGDFYTKLKDITMNRKTGDDCKTFVLEVLIDNDGSSFDGWVEEVVVKPTSYGGAQGGVSIPYKVSFTGNRTHGSVSIASSVPTFTADT